MKQIGVNTLQFKCLQLESKSLQPCEEKPLFQPISYENILVAFFILPIGIFMAMMTLMLEKAKNKWQSSMWAIFYKIK
jgi:hypothetical protein